MNPYEFRVSLRISHPTIEPQLISNALGYTPSRIWKVGEPRKTPTGRSLDGTYSESYWCTDLDNRNSVSSETINLETFLLYSTITLKEHADFFNEIRESGGRTEYFVSVFNNSSIGCMLNSELIECLSDVGIELGLDISTTENAGT